MYKIGFSLSRCVRDIVDDKVASNHVLAILSRTKIATWEDMMSVVDAYEATQIWDGSHDWHHKCISVLNRLWSAGRIVQYRNETSDFGNFDSVYWLRKLLSDAGTRSPNWIDIAPSGNMNKTAIADAWNKDEPYWSPTNDALAAQKVGTFLCPSNGLTTDDFGGTASNGKFYGQSHYMPVAYVDLSPVDGTRNKAQFYKPGLLTYNQTSTMGSARDGTSKTVIFFEDAGRTQADVGKASRSSGGNTVWVKTNGSKVTVMGPSIPGWIDGNGNTCPNRWADSDNASGLSGPPHTASVPGNRQILNNTKTPIGGSAATCLWTQNNCGPNDEPFSQHPGLVMAGLADGSVRALNEDLDLQVCRRLADPKDGEVVGDF